MNELSRPEIYTHLRKNIIKVPEIIEKRASGITINGRTIRSLMFTTDIAVITNCNADAIIAVYPFTPNLTLSRAILDASDVPVICGVGGGMTHGMRCANVALHAEFQGALAVVLNVPTTMETLRDVRRMIDIPIVFTVCSEHTDFQRLLDNGADLLNVSGGADTAYIIRKIREKSPNVPIIATGGQTDENILKTIEAGANAITYTPPLPADTLKSNMERFRKTEREKAGIID